MTAAHDLDLDTLLRERFGFDAFRPGQREAIETLLADRSLLCIQPTGYGKSLLYQLPAAALDGIAVVISPLLALMRDQLAHLNGRWGIPAGSLNSDQSLEENDAVRAAALEGRLKILFVSPEQLDRVDRAELIARLPLSLVVIDEAHCISTWGHDFRPAYRQIAPLLRAVVERRPEVRVLALTATANARTEADIRAQLGAVGGRALRVQRRGMDRPNLALAVHRVGAFEEKLAWLGREVSARPGPGLLYCATRDNTEVVADFLSSRGLSVVAYHAGLAPDRKRALQASFLRGDFQAIAATNALGMGIDKSDLRYVVHVDVPGSITAYYQEVGRAGRDGLPARGILLYDPQDLRIQEYFIQSAQPTPEDFDVVMGVLRQRAAAGEPPRAAQLRAASGLHPTRVTVVLAELVEQGFVEKVRDGRSQVYVPTDRDGSPELTRYTTQDRVRRAELTAMTRYAEDAEACLMQTLRRALGDDAATRCGRCEACGGGVLTRAPGSGSDSDPDVGDWLAERPVVVRGYRRTLTPGLAVLDSQRRSAAFVGFMRRRASADQPDLDPGLARRLEGAARRLVTDLGEAPTALVCLPSRTWRQRERVARGLADALGARLYLDALAWDEVPEARQGELLNNDQRKANVAGKLRWREGPLSPGAVVLLDDYVGSGATLRDAARVLQKQAAASGPIAPLTVARVRWRLGRPGIV